MLLELDDELELVLLELFDEEFELELSELFDDELLELFELELSELFELELSELFEEELELELLEPFSCQAIRLEPDVRSALAVWDATSANGTAAVAPVATMAPAMITVSFDFMILSFVHGSAT